MPWKYRSTSVGLEISGCTTKLDNPDKDGNGEVCMNGRNIFMGYLNEEAKTKEVFDDEGYIRSGDIGKRDDDGFLYITGRIKELLITAGGENVAPVLIEDAIKEQLPCVSNCMLVGDQRKFLSVLLTLKVELDPETSEPTDKLSPFVLDWYRSLDCDATTVTEILKKQHKPVMKAIQEGIDRANTKAISRAQFVQKWKILERDFSIPGGELGPTMKLKRSLVSKLYASTIDSLYAYSGRE
jgi:long-chain-fatty-acid--CoA ligase ACSBG